MPSFPIVVLKNPVKTKIEGIVYLILFLAALGSVFLSIQWLTIITVAITIAVGIYLRFKNEYKTTGNVHIFENHLIIETEENKEKIYLHEIKQIRLSIMGYKDQNYLWSLNPFHLMDGTNNFLYINTIDKAYKFDIFLTQQSMPKLKKFVNQFNS
ncbi:MAG: hypothetical protein KBE91_09445 [Bacteroidia bacterium]|nr:hypothetical protein [Bacteroidia bacterium]